MRERTQEIVTTILESAGYGVECADEPFDLSAVGDRDCYVVLISDDADEIGNFDGRRFRIRQGEEIGECQKILVTFDAGARAENCTIWGEEEIARYAGEAALARIFGRTFSLGKSAKTSLPGNAMSMGGILHLPVRVSDRNAISISGTRGEAHCRFVPYWCCHCTSSGSQTVFSRRVSFDADRWGGLNAINGSKMEMKLSDAINSTMPEDCEVLQPKIAKEEAENQTVNDLITELTQKVRFRKEEGDAIFYQEETLKPDRRNISTEITLVYVPVWEIEGKNRIVEVNAYTGEILAMPMDEGVEIF
ncbi:hypothetical protein [uncultured Methanofollis sp.]|uniref:hypothetical protein n=1 Tax=uncultured Methanofollis sp. TaxID=262500 RepID=UPI0026225B7F|nr:hypothetical protein [uncultured Methanofollis sp.]